MAAQGIRVELGGCCVGGGRLAGCEGEVGEVWVKRRQRVSRVRRWKGAALQIFRAALSGRAVACVTGRAGATTRVLRAPIPAGRAVAGAGSLAAGEPGGPRWWGGAATALLE